MLLENQAGEAPAKEKKKRNDTESGEEKIFIVYVTSARDPKMDGSES